MKMNVRFKTNCLNLKVCLEMTGNKAAKKRSQSGNCNLAIREVPRGTNRSARSSGQNKNEDIVGPMIFKDLPCIRFSYRSIAFSHRCLCSSLRHPLGAEEEFHILFPVNFRSFRNGPIYHVPST